MLEEEDDESVGHAVKGVKLVAGGAVPGRAALRGFRMLAECHLVVARVETTVRQRARDVRPDIGFLAVREAELAIRGGLEVLAEGEHEVAVTEKPSGILNRPRRGAQVQDRMDCRLGDSVSLLEVANAGGVRARVVRADFRV